MTMTVINTNVKSLVAQNALTVNNRSLSKAMEQLSTGKRINSASDDAAGLAISNKMTSQVRGLAQAIRNASDGISLLQTAEGATKEVTNMLQRMRELAVQAANDTYSEVDRDAIQAEVDQLVDEVDRINENTIWNGMLVFDGTSIGDGAGSISFFAGVGAADTAASDVIDVEISSIGSDSLGVDTVDISALDVSTSADAIEAIATLDEAIVSVDKDRATYGAKINRLTSASDNMANVSLNISASRSRIEDADYAAATTELARTQIISQAATAMLAQANQQPQNVLSLLR
jgi:flagellin